jgi:hypothetical protein
MSIILNKYANKYFNFIYKYYLLPTTSGAIVVTSVVSNIAYETYKANNPENNKLYKYKSPIVYGLSNGLLGGSLLMFSWPILIPSYAIFITVLGIQNGIQTLNKIDTVSNNN